MLFLEAGNNARGWYFISKLLMSSVNRNLSEDLLPCSKPHGSMDMRQGLFFIEYHYAICGFAAQ